MFQVIVCIFLGVKHTFDQFSKKPLKSHETRCVMYTSILKDCPFRREVFQDDLEFYLNQEKITQMMIVIIISRIYLLF
jgi:hypothetical protein